MSGARFLLALGLLPVMGWCVAKFFPLPAEDLLGRIPTLAALGALTLTLLMVGLTWAGVPWSFAILTSPYVALGTARLAGRRAMPQSRSRKPIRGFSLAVAIALLGIALVAYCAGSARSTAADFLLFWGVKGERFAAAAGIDTSFLTTPSMHLMHPDYPPLLPLIFAWGGLIAGRFPWGAALLTLPLFLALAAMAFASPARRELGSKRAAELSAVLVTLLGYGLCQSLCAGNAEPPLLFFETLALAALSFRRQTRDGFFLASLALGGAALTKLEGAAFAGVVILVYGGLGALSAKSIRPLLQLSTFPVVALSLWIGFARTHGMIDVYGPAARAPLHLEHFQKVVSGILANAGYNTAYLPWILLALLLMGGGPGPPSLRPLFVGIVYLGFVAFCYLHDAGDPSLWISWSAGRLLITTQLCLFFAAAARRELPSPRR